MLTDLFQIHPPAAFEPGSQCLVYEEAPDRAWEERVTGGALTVKASPWQEYVRQHLRFDNWWTVVASDFQGLALMALFFDALIAARSREGVHLLFGVPAPLKEDAVIGFFPRASLPAQGILGRVRAYRAVEVAEEEVQGTGVLFPSIRMECALPRRERVRNWFGEQFPGVVGRSPRAAPAPPPVYTVTLDAETAAYLTRRVHKAPAAMSAFERFLVRLEGRVTPAGEDLATLALSRAEVEELLRFSQGVYRQRGEQLGKLVPLLTTILREAQ